MDYANTENNSTDTNDTRTRKYSYRECWRGDFARPETLIESIVFDLLFALFMGSLMLLFMNLVANPILIGQAKPISSELFTAVTMLPGIVSAAFAARRIYADKASMFLFRRWIIPHCNNNIVSSILLVFVNVLLMAPFMCCCAVLIACGDINAILNALTGVLPYAALAGFLISLILVRPLVMMIFSNVIIPILHNRKSE